MTQHIAFIGLGSNLGDSCEQIKLAFTKIAKFPGINLLAASSLYRSAPIGFLEQPDFVNAVAKVATHLTPQALLVALLAIEQHYGRERTFHNAPRTLDLDVLLYDDLQLQKQGLTVPHPKMHLRAFVLLPLLELAPDCMIPAIGSARLAMRDCRDQSLEKIKT